MPSPARGRESARIYRWRRFSSETVLTFPSIHESPPTREGHEFYSRRQRSNQTRLQALRLSRLAWQAQPRRLKPSLLNCLSGSSETRALPEKNSALPENKFASPLKYSASGGTLARQGSVYLTASSRSRRRRGVRAHVICYLASLL
jgi:hypothetical protein